MSVMRGRAIFRIVRRGVMVVMRATDDQQPARTANYARNSKNR